MADIGDEFDAGRNLHAGQLSTLLIDLDAVIDNWRMLARAAPGAECAAAVKAEAYGLGMIPISRALVEAGCHVFFVANLDEAIALRTALPNIKIYILNGFLGCSVEELIEYDLSPVLNDLGQVESWADHCRRYERGGGAIHFDTGINRLGLDAEETRRFLDRPELVEAIRPDFIMSHLACSEDPEHDLNRIQLQRFEALRAKLPPCPASLAASAGALMGAQYHFDLIRPGIGLYGGNPFSKRANTFSQVITLKAKILQVREIDGPEGVGYGATPSAPGRRRIATVAAGYADGYLRDFDNAGLGIAGNKKVPVVGRISMDLTSLDVTACDPQAVLPGQTITLIGDGITMDDVQKASGMSQYQLLTQLGHRYRRLYRFRGREFRA